MWFSVAQSFGCPLLQVSRLALSGLRNWTTAASPSAVFAARHFRPFLPPRGHVELGEPWWIIPSELSVFTGYLSNNRFYPPPPKGKEVRAARALAQAQPPPLLLAPPCCPTCSQLLSGPIPTLAFSRFPADPHPGDPGPAGLSQPSWGPTAVPPGRHPPAPEHVPPATLREDPLCPSGGRRLPDCHQRLLLHGDVPVSGPRSATLACPLGLGLQGTAQSPHTPVSTPGSCPSSCGSLSPRFLVCASGWW